MMGSTVEIPCLISAASVSSFFFLIHNLDFGYPHKGSRSDILSGGGSYMVILDGISMVYAANEIAVFQVWMVHTYTINHHIDNTKLQIGLCR